MGNIHFFSNGEWTIVKAKLKTSLHLKGSHELTKCVDVDHTSVQNLDVLASGQCDQARFLDAICCKSRFFTTAVIFRRWEQLSGCPKIKCVLKKKFTVIFYQYRLYL